MFKLNFFFAIFCLTLLKTAYPQSTYDSYLLAIEFPGVVNYNFLVKKVCKTRKCTSEYTSGLSRTTINMHGLWPNRNDGNHPFFCTKEDYNPNVIDSDVMNDLNHNWNGLYSSTTRFRSHEYTKHGTCFNPKLAGTSKFLENSESNQNLFWKTGLMIKKNTGLEEVVFEKSSEDEIQYDSDEIKKIISSSLGGINKFQMSCSSVNGKNYLMELRICVSLDYKFFNCGSSWSENRACPNGKIYVAAFKPIQ